MKKPRLHVKSLVVLCALSLFCFGAPTARAQSPSTQDNARVQDNDTTRSELAKFDQFMDSHREIAEQLRKDPSLVNKSDFVEQHPALQTFLEQQPGIREELRENPNTFMRQENAFDRREDARDNDANREALAKFDQFMDGHREIAEQLRKDPSLANDRTFVEQHPALQAYLEQQPDVRDHLRDNPNEFMRQENTFDHREDASNRDTHEQFREFLGGHSDINKDLSRDSSLVKDRDYMDHHPEFQAYLKDHPDVHDDLMKNPQEFVKSAQQPGTSDHGNYGGAPKTQTFDPAKTPDTKPKQ